MPNLGLGDYLTTTKLRLTHMNRRPRDLAEACPGRDGEFRQSGIASVQRVSQAQTASAAVLSDSMQCVTLDGPTSSNASQVAGTRQAPVERDAQSPRWINVICETLHIDKHEAERVFTQRPSGSDRTRFTEDQCRAIQAVLDKPAETRSVDDLFEIGMLDRKTSNVKQIISADEKYHVQVITQGFIKDDRNPWFDECIEAAVDKATEVFVRHVRKGLYTHADALRGADHILVSDRRVYWAQSDCWRLTPAIQTKFDKDKLKVFLDRDESGRRVRFEATMRVFDATVSSLKSDSGICRWLNKGRPAQITYHSVSADSFGPPINQFTFDSYGAGYTDFGGGGGFGEF